MPIPFTYTGDVSDLKRATQEARTELGKVGAEAEKTSRALKASANVFDGTKIEGAARRAASAVEKIGGVTKLTGTELTSLERKITEAVNKFHVMGTAVPADIQKVARNIAELRAHEEDLARSAEKATQALRAQGQQVARAAVAPAPSGLAQAGTALASGLGVGLGAGAGLAAIASVGETLRDIAAQGAALTPLQQSFERLQGGARQAAVQLAGLKQATRGLVDETSLLQAANKGNLLGLDAMGIAFEDVAAVATRLGRAMGQDAAQSVDDLTTALARQSPMILDNLGIKVSLTEANEAYARSIGKSVEQLTDEEKKLAFATAAMEAARAKAASLGEATLTVTEQWAKLTTLITDGAVALASSANESEGLAGAIDGLIKRLEHLEELRRQANAEEAQLAENQKDEGAAVFTLSNYYKLLGLNIELALEARRKLAQALNQNFFEADLRRNPQLLEQSLDALGTPVSGGPFNRLELSQQRVQAPTFADLMRQGAERAKEFAEQERQVREAMAREQERADAKRLADAQKLREELERISGVALIKDAERLAKNLNTLGDVALPTAQTAAFAKQLMEAAEAAEQTGRAISRDVTQALQRLVSSPAYREIFQRSLTNPAIGLGERSNFSGITGSALTTAITGGLPSSTIADTFNTFEAARMRTSIAGITVDFQKGVPAIKNWSTELRNVATSFAQLAQIAGESMDDVTRAIGTAIGGADLGQQIADRLGLTNAEGKLTQGGRALSGAVAGFAVGSFIGGLTTNRLGATAGGIASGAAAGFMVGGPIGAGFGAAVGGISALVTSSSKGAQERRDQQRAIQQQREQIVASMGGLAEFRQAVERTGEAYGKFLNEFLSSDVDVFTGAVNRLNRALTQQQSEATNLAKALASVSSVQGVLSRQQLQQLHDVGSRRGPGSEAIVEFAEQQRAQAEQGLTSAVGALVQRSSLTEQEIADLTRGISDEAEKLRVVEAELARRATSTLQQFGLGAQAAASGLFVAFSEAVRMGESAIDVLRRLGPSIQGLQTIFQRAGVTPGAGFQNLQVLQEIATGKETGPAVQLAQGLGQALAAFANTGLLSPELFGELANGIGQAYHQLELFGKGGLEAARLMQPSLQAIWAMVDANPELRDQLDDTTLALLDFAEKNGLVGDKFRPAIDRMIEALDKLIERIGDLIDSIADVPPIDVPVTYTPGEMPPPPNPPGTPGGPPSGRPIDPETGEPRLALGGIVTRPTHALIGEAGPEAVIPLSRLGRFSTPIQITVISQIDGYEAARAITRYQPDVYRTYGAA